MKVMYLYRPDLCWAVNSLASVLSKWNVAADKRLHRLIAYMHHHSDFVQMAWVGDKIQDCIQVEYADSSYVDGQLDSHSTSGGWMALLGLRTFVPLGWICKKHASRPDCRVQIFRQRDRQQDLRQFDKKGKHTRV